MSVVLELVGDLLKDGAIGPTVVVDPLTEEPDFEGAFLAAVAFA